MGGRARNLLTALVAVALVVVVAAWYLAARPVRYQLSTLTRIDYSPAAAPYLTYTFSQPVPPGQVAGNTALLRSFTVDAASPTPPAAAAGLIALLTKGLPFAPNAQPLPNALTTNVLQAGAPPTPMTVTGSGTMWLIVPKA